MMAVSDKIIEIRHLSKTLGNKKVLDDITIDIRKGEFVTFLGLQVAARPLL